MKLLGGKNEEMEVEIGMEPRHKGRAEGMEPRQARGRCETFFICSVFWHYSP